MNRAGKAQENTSACLSFDGNKLNALLGLGDATKCFIFSAIGDLKGVSEVCDACVIFFVYGLGFAAGSFTLGYVACEIGRGTSMSLFRSMKT
jgi:hypothetical protein